VSLRVRIALILAAVALGVSATVAVLSYLGTAASQRDSIDDTLTSRAAAVNEVGGGRDGRDEGGRGDGDDCPPAGQFAPASAAQLVDTAGVVTVCIEGAPTLPVSDGNRSLDRDQTRLRTVSVGGEDYRVLATPWHAGGTLQVARSFSEANDLLGRLRLQLVLLVVVATALAAGLGWAFATALTRPITQLRDATHRIATTLDFDTPVDVTGPGEVGSLATSFATMVGAVRRSQEQQRRLVSDASHEMRTPLTSLRSNVEIFRQIERLPAAEREEVIVDVLEDVDELATLLSELVDLASDLATAEAEELVELAELARAAAARTERRTGRTVGVDAGTSVELSARPRQMERAIANLIDNSVKYSDPDTAVDVTIDGATVTVSDRGRGIPPEDLDHIFDRFYRAVDARSEPGSGLGLSIVLEIVRSHGGEVFARNRQGGGSEVGFTLPVPAET
jgi:two-component system sensor histidine kinase MprB